MSTCFATQCFLNYVLPPNASQNIAMAHVNKQRRNNAKSLLLAGDTCFATCRFCVLNVSSTNNQ